MIKKYFGRFRKPLTETPNLVISQVESFKWLIEKGLKEVFEEFSSIKDFSEKKFQLDFVGFEGASATQELNYEDGEGARNLHGRFSTHDFSRHLCHLRYRACGSATAC